MGSGCADASADGNWAAARPRLDAFHRDQSERIRWTRWRNSPPGISTIRSWLLGGADPPRARLNRSWLKFPKHMHAHTLTHCAHTGTWGTQVESCLSSDTHTNLNVSHSGHLVQLRATEMCVYREPSRCSLAYLSRWAQLFRAAQTGGFTLPLWVTAKGSSVSFIQRNQINKPADYP